MGTLNARIWTLSEIIEVDNTIPELEEFENVFRTIDLCKIYGLYILNGRFQPDKNIGNFTKTHISSNGSSVIDYGICTLDMIQRVVKLSVEERTESDHLPILMSFECQQNAKVDIPDDKNKSNNSFLGYKISDG